MNVPENLKYSKDHEWILVEGTRAKVGITDYAQDALGDVVYVDLPEVDAEVEADTTCAEVESTKSVSDIFAPLTGTIAEVNEALDEEPERLNTDPYGAGWIFVMALGDDADLSGLMTAAQYTELTEG
jgi:glycine cleavage system H protein